MKYIDVRNLNFCYDKKIIFKDLNFSINKVSLVSIITPSSSGKTTLLNILSGNLITNENVYINDKEINSKKKNKISMITPSINIFSKTILEDLLLVTSNTIRIKKILKEFGLIESINKSLSDLTYFELQKINLIKTLLSKPEIILIDNIFSYFDKYSTIEYIGLIKKYQMDKGITVIFTSTNLEDTIFSDKVIIIDKEKLYDGPIDKMYLNNKLIKQSKIKIPTENELIEKLKLYDVIDNINYSIEEVVDEICR